MELRGLVARKTVARGSKSEREAIVIETTTYAYVLRFQGGHAFADPRLAALVGKRIAAVGEISGDTFLVHTYEVE